MGKTIDEAQADEAEAEVRLKRARAEAEALSARSGAKAAGSIGQQSGGAREQSGSAIERAMRAKFGSRVMSQQDVANALDSAAADIDRLRQRLAVAEAVVNTVNVFQQALNGRPGGALQAMGEDPAWRLRSIAEVLRDQHRKEMQAEEAKQRAAAQQAQERFRDQKFKPIRMSSAMQAELKVSGPPFPELTVGEYTDAIKRVYGPEDEAHPADQEAIKAASGLFSVEEAERPD